MGLFWLLFVLFVLFFVNLFRVLFGEKFFFNFFAIMLRPFWLSVACPFVFSFIVFLLTCCFGGVNEVSKSLFYSIFIVSLLAPVFEEVIFRGLVLGFLLFVVEKTNFEKTRRIVLVWMIQALVFALAHPTHRQLFAFVSGIIYGGGYFLYWVSEKKKNLLPSIIVHVLNNFFITLKLLFF